MKWENVVGVYLLWGGGEDGGGGGGHIGAPGQATFPIRAAQQSGCRIGERAKLLQRGEGAGGTGDQNTGAPGLFVRGERWIPWGRLRACGCQVGAQAGPYIPSHAGGEGFWKRGSNQPL